MGLRGGILMQFCFKFGLYILRLNLLVILSEFVNVIPVHLIQLQLKGTAWQQSKQMDIMIKIQCLKLSVSWLKLQRAHMQGKHECMEKQVYRSVHECTYALTIQLYRSILNFSENGNHKTESRSSVGSKSSIQAYGGW